MNANTKHLLKWYAVGVFFGGLVLFGLIAAVRRGEYLPAIVVPVVIGIVALIMHRARSKALLLFREPTPDRAIAYYHSSMQQIPTGRAMAAYLSAFAAVHYGQFDRAREELAAVNWTSLPPMYQGFETSVHSLLAILEAKDYSRALGLAEEARDLCSVPGAFPGGKTSRATLESIVDVCELLTGQGSPELVDRVRAAVKALPGISPAVPAWALSVYYQKLGQDAVAAEYSAVVRRLVPHSTCLDELRPAISATVG